MGRADDMLTMSRQWMHPKQKERKKEKTHRSTVTNHRALVPPVYLQQKEDARGPRRREAHRNGTIAAVAVVRMVELPLAVGLGVRHLCCAQLRGQQRVG